MKKSWNAEHSRPYAAGGEALQLRVRVHGFFRTGEEGFPLPVRQETSRQPCLVNAVLIPVR